MNTTRRGLLALGTATLAAPAILHAQTTLATLRGKTIVVNWPEVPHYIAAAAMIPDFTAATGIKVELDRMQYLRMHDKQVLELSKAAGDYDVVPYVVTWKTEYVGRKFLEPLEPLMSGSLADPAYDKADLVTGYLENVGLVGGPKGYLPGPGAQLYGIPFGAETSVLAYRTDIFEKYGLAPPRTYDAMLAAARTIHEKEPGMGGLVSRGQAGQPIMHAWLLHFSPNGGVFFDDKWEPRFAEAPGVRAAEILRTIAEIGPPGTAAFGFGEMLNAFLQGQSAMYLDTIAVFGPVKDPKASRIAGKVAYLPHPSAARASSETGGFGMAIPRNSVNKEAAFAFIQWMTSKAQDKRLALAGGVASRSSTLRDADVLAKYPEYAVLPEALKIANPDWRPIIQEWGEINEQIMGPVMSEIMTDKQQAKPALESLVPKVKAVMQRAGYYRA